VLRISIHNGANAATLKLEGKVIGPWARELNRVWSAFEPSLGMKKLCLDLCGVTFVDKAGTKALQKIFRLTDAEILADTPLTRQFVADAMRALPQNDRREV
jgi:ABC-type transporter Mla MlaB component